MKVMTEETFGPVIPVMPFATLEEGIRLANEGDYGLSANVLAGSEAEALASRMGSDFGDPAGGLYSTAKDHEALIVRHREGHDGATPSANAVAARCTPRNAATARPLRARPNFNA